MKIVKDIRKDPIKMALAILLVIQFCLISFSNITLIDKNLNCDIAMLFTHIAEIWKQKNFVLPDWNYVTTLEWDCSSILALPFYALTHNIILSFGLSNIIFLFCFLYIIFFLFRDEDILYPLLCANLLIIPYRIGMLDYYNMLFFGGGQYIIKVSIPLLLVGVVLYLDNLQAEEHLSISIKLLMMMYLGLLFISAMSSGVYVTICGVFPVFGVYIGYKFFRWEKLSYNIIFLIICSGILAVAGWKINMALMGGAVGNSMTFCSVYQMLASISSCLFGMFELYGGATESFEIRVLSMEGIQILAKYAVVLVMLISGICAAKHIIMCSSNKNKCLAGIFENSNSTMIKNENFPLRSLLLLSIFFWNIFVLIISFPRGGSSTYEYRYHLIGSLPLMCVTCIYLLKSIRKLQVKQQNCLYAAGYLVILFLCVTSYKKLYFSEELYSDLKELCSYVKELDLHVEYVYLFNDFSDSESELCRVIDESSSYICLLENGRTLAFDYYNYYIDAPMQTDNVVVVVNDEEYQFGDSFEIEGYRLEKFAAVGNRSLYYFIN